MEQDEFQALITPQAMADIDREAAETGLDSFSLMLRAGRAVAAAVLRHYPQLLRAVVLCGPGNNGGDGYIAAEALRLSGVPVAVFCHGDPDRLKGDAARAKAACSSQVAPLAEFVARAGDVVIDALFGAGLARDLSPEICAAIERVKDAGLPVVAVDLPSGIDGLTGQPRPVALEAAQTVTFMALKPGHVLLPGRVHCGAIEVFDIGIPRRIMDRHRGSIARNHPLLWQASLPCLQAQGHKFSRGHLTVFSGPISATGAARLSAMAGLRAGAGLVTLASSASALMVNASQTTAVMVKKIEDEMALDAYLADQRLSAFVLGPGFGVGEKARGFISRLCGRKLVLDADGISSFKDDPAALFSLFAEGETRLVMTPHAGEFARLFPDLAAETRIGKVEQTVRAAQRSHAVLVHKGADTVIASPDGRALINDNAPAWLATAGSGDVLAGVIGGLLAQGVPAFEAAAAGVYLHGEAGQRAGDGMTAEDLVKAVRPFQAATAC
ncbi:NAD(P)H-hydrate dehydratase [Allorhizobium sp. BGMRC 0089]|uniref:NAD(P)H-hydrate dehydratase n=1 Tax=Allorhizobium sonneratiae TaxID=2934936 RepID=UPI00237CD631|nr:NAD(P)H-hydrate dehydratase [Allorhizobium sonneratiae]MCM2292963.1 NAD(P)H-hydrate dehydratase [Allorhizobium sonneratiae]